MKSDYPYSSRQAESQWKLLVRWFKLPRPLDNEPKVARQTRYFTRRSPVDSGKRNNSCFTYKNPGYFAKNCFQLHELKDALHLFEDHFGSYLDKKDDLESVYSLEEELIEDTIFSIDVCEKSGDIYVAEDNQKSASQFLIFNTPGILSF